MSLRLLAALCLLCFALPGMGRADAPAAGSPVVSITLANGLRVLCRREAGTPLVAVDVFVRAGAAQETAETSGVGSLVARTLLASTASNTPETMTAAINALGGSVSAVWHPDWTQISALTVPDRFSDAVFLLSDVLRNADFGGGDPKVLEDARGQLLAAQDVRDADQYALAYAGLTRALYAGTSYARPEGGTSATVRRLTQADLAGYYRRFYVPANTVLVVVGDVAPEAALAQVRSSLEDWTRVGQAVAPAPAPLPPLTQSLPPTRVFRPDLDQQIVLAGVRAAPASDPDYPALLVANALLGGMKSGRLFTRLREQQGLAYDLGSTYTPRLSAGDLAAYVYSVPTRTDAATKKDVPTVGLVKESLFQQFAALAAAPPTATELARAKHFLVGADALRHERLEDRATLLGAAALSGPGSDGSALETEFPRFINAVTAADVQRVARKYFAHPVLSTIEPDAKAGGAGAAGG